MERADVAIVGVPFDSGVTYRPGARFGPAHIREASQAAAPVQPRAGRRALRRQQVADAGDIACNPFDITEAIAADRARAPDALAERAPSC